MKNVFKGFIILLTLACFSCQDEAEITDTQTKTTIADGDIAIIRSLGLDIEKVVDYGDYYLIEDDISLEKKYLSKYLNNQDVNDTTLQLRQSYTGSIVSTTNVKNITVGFDSSLPTSSEWRTVTLKALNEWNSIPGSLVKFVYTTSSSPAIKIYQNYTNDNRIADADFPSSGRPGSYVKINSKYNNLLTSEKLHAVVHELGHTIGFRHTDWHSRPDGGKESNAIAIPGTPTTDSYSIMNAINSFWDGFSYYDVIATQYLYPSPIIASTNLVGVNENVTYSIPNYSGPVTWSASSNVSFVSGQGTNSGIFKGVGNGYASIKATVSYSGNSFTLANNNSVWVGPPSVPTSISGLNREFNAYTEYFIGTEAIPGATSYSWDVQGDVILPYGNSGLSVRIQTKNVMKGGSFAIYLTATNKYGSRQYGDHGIIKEKTDHNGNIGIEKD